MASGCCLRELRSTTLSPETAAELIPLLCSDLSQNSLYHVGFPQPSVWNSIAFCSGPMHTFLTTFPLLYVPLSIIKSNFCFIVSPLLLICKLYEGEDFVLDSIWYLVLLTVLVYSRLFSKYLLNELFILSQWKLFNYFSTFS